MREKDSSEMHTFIELADLCCMHGQFGGRADDPRLHKVLTYIEHHSVCPLVGIGTPPPL